MVERPSPKPALFYIRASFAGQDTALTFQVPYNIRLKWARGLFGLSSLSAISIP